VTHDNHRDSTLVVFGDSLSDNGNLLALIGYPPPPDWQGRFSNGPNYIDQIAQLLHTKVDDRAFGFAEASDASPPLLVDPATGNPLPINLSDQIAGYLADLDGHRAPHDTTALINIGSNDYDAFFFLGLDPSTIQSYIANVVGSIEQAVDALTQAGVGKIILYTLPDFGLSPNAQAEGPQVVAEVHAVDLINNAALHQIAASHPNVELVDVFQLTEAFGAAPQAFGFNPDLNVTWKSVLAAGTHQFAPNELAFFDGEHPTSAAHGVIAAFSDAVLTSDSTQFLDGTQSVIHAGHGDNFIFATPIDPTNHALNDNYTIYGGAGDDIIYAGTGNVTVHGGSGNDLIFAGTGNATLDGGSGTDVLETSSAGINRLIGGEDGDTLIVNRAGTNTLVSGGGNDLFVLKEGASLVSAGGGFNFGQQVISGGAGHDTLRFIINDQNPSAEQTLIAEFHKVEAAFDLAASHGHAGSFEVDGLHVGGIERIELQIDSVSTDPNTPYLITHDIALADGHGGGVSEALNHMLQTADHWNLLTV
jgi:Ca2+-binding RTX toxin-like protein